MGALDCFCRPSGLKLTLFLTLSWHKLQQILTRYRYVNSFSCRPLAGPHITNQPMERPLKVFVDPSVRTTVNAQLTRKVEMRSRGLSTLPNNCYISASSIPDPSHDSLSPWLMNRAILVDLSSEPLAVLAQTNFRCRGQRSRRHQRTSPGRRAGTSRTRTSAAGRRRRRSRRRRQFLSSTKACQR